MAGYVPLPPLMTSQAPERKGQIMSAYTLGAGASMAFGPLIGTVFIGVIGIGGVMCIYAALHLLSTVLVLCLKTPAPPSGPRCSHRRAPDGAAGGSSVDSALRGVLMEERCI
ncbi:MFS transporter [Streptomyces nigrescens]